MVKGEVILRVRSRMISVVSVAVFLAAGSHSTVYAEGSCSNEQLRAEDNSTRLPDCRAYEMVSPSYTEGFNVKALKFSVHSTSSLGASGSFSSDAFFGQSFGIFAGAKNTKGPFGSIYLFRRTSSGWITVPFESSLAEFPDSNTEEPIISSNLQSSIWEFGSGLPESTATPNHDYYLRNPVGTFDAIGPSAPPGTKLGPARLDVTPEELGASRDLSHFLFTSTDTSEEEPFWPGDDTIVEHPSLYEYVGVNNAAPTIVGVKGENHELISQCGTSLGGNSEAGGAAPVYNAVSETGAAVFFTAEQGGCFGVNPQTKAEEEGKGPPVREIYGRLNGEETVAISEPTTGAGGDCEACQEGAPAGAFFQAASADGSKVLFTTEQELLPENPGNTLYEYDFKAATGHKIIAISHLASGAGVQGLATVSPDLAHIYFVATGILSVNPNAQGHKAEAGKDNLYVYEPDSAHPGQSKTVYIGTLSPSDFSDWAGFTVHDENSVQVTPDGRHLLFSSTADLTPDDTSTASQLFQYDAETDNLIRVSVCQSGYNCNNNSDVVIGTGQHEQSTDGAYVFFNSIVPLVPQAAASAGFASVYEYHDGNVYLISDGRDTTGFANSHGSEVVGVSPSGSDAYFVTGDPLLPSDTNTQVGVYDARTGGGFPQFVAAPECKEEACQGQLSPPLTGQSPASSSLTGTGNLAPLSFQPVPPQIKCPKGRKLNHGKCVKVKARKKKSKAKKPGARRSGRKTGHNNRRTT